MCIRDRIFTIEDGSRELQLIREQNGRVVNSVVHTQTRDSENERQRIDQICLLYTSDFIGILREEHLPDWARESLKQIRQKDPAESPDMTTPTM